MDEQFRALTLDYYGAVVPTCRIANIQPDGLDVLVVKPFDPDTTEALVQLGTELGWTYELIPGPLIKTIRFARCAV